MTKIECPRKVTTKYSDFFLKIKYKTLFFANFNFTTMDNVDILTVLINPDLVYL